MKQNLQIIVYLLLANSFGAFAQSTSTNPNASAQGATKPRNLSVNSSQVITFSEYEAETSITDQYKNIGVIFESGAFTSTDGATASSPVLSGTPLFKGSITGKFVTPGTNQTTAVQSFSFDAGHFDNLGSTRVEWFNPGGEKLGQKINSQYGIETFTVTGGNIASFTISIVASEPAGYAVDNISFVASGSSIVFRENFVEMKKGTWGKLKDQIPGFDHVGLHFENKVYESHPGYEPGVYNCTEGKEEITIVSKNGVQLQHALATFKHNARIGETSPVFKLEEIPIDEELANKMKTKIALSDAYTFEEISFDFPSGVQQTLLPAVQKGKNNTFTCVGLVEWAAEQAGYNGGQGFIPDIMESFNIILESAPFEVPALSPQLLNYAMKSQQLLSQAKQWVQGYFDPVDFIITDPLGRKLGFSQGISYNEIPNTFYPGDGNVEQFLIPQAVPGLYKVQLTGKGANAFAAIGALNASESFSGMLTEGQILEKTIIVKPTPGCAGDLTWDGAVDINDVYALTYQLNQFTDGVGHPGDLDGDGLLANADLELLRKLVNNIALPVTLIKFEGKALPNGHNQLEWITNSEINNDYFEIFRSEDASNFKSISKIKGAGNSNVKNSYLFTDEAIPLKAITYYRLNQVDFDGSATPTRIIMIKAVNEEFNVFVFPNPAQYIIEVETKNNAPVENLTLFDLNGKALIQNSKSSKMDISTLEKGFYFIQIRTSSGAYIRKKIVKH